MKAKEVLKLLNITRVTLHNYVKNGIIKTDSKVNGFYNYNEDSVYSIINKNMERSEPKPNEIWKHFKGNLYKIIAVGHHSETKDKLVVYFDLSSKNSTVDDPCIRPLDMFMSEVDRDKYPDVKQKYRFELAQTVLNFQK